MTARALFRRSDRAKQADLCIRGLELQVLSLDEGGQRHLLERIERPGRKLAPREFGANRIPPILPRRLLNREICVGEKIQIENLVRNRRIAIRFDLQRPIEMPDCGGDFSLPAETPAEQSECGES